jgi:hypothetical protein
MSYQATHATTAADERLPLRINDTPGYRVHKVPLDRSRDDLPIVLNKPWKYHYLVNDAYYTLVAGKLHC